MRLRFTGALAATAVIFPAAAPATILRTKHFVFDMTLRGSQTTTWHVFRKGNPSACAPSITTDGDQMIRFQTAKPERVEVAEPVLDRPHFSTDLSVDATAERTMEFRTGKPVLIGRTCVRIDPQPPVIEPGCGTRTGKITIRLGLRASDMGGQNQPDPLPLSPDANHLRIAGNDADWGAGQPLLARYLECPMLVPIGGYRPNMGELLEAAGHFNESLLLGKPKLLRVSASRIEPLPAGLGLTGQSIVTYNLTLRRLGSS